MLNMRYAAALLIHLPLMAMQAPESNQSVTYLHLLPREIRLEVAKALVYQNYQDQPQTGLFKAIFNTLIRRSSVFTKDDLALQKARAIEAVNTYLEAHDTLVDQRQGSLLNDPHALGTITLALCDRFDTILSLKCFATLATPEWLKSGLSHIWHTHGDFNKGWEQILPILETATMLKNTDLFKRLASMQDKFGGTVLYWAVRSGNTKVVGWLLENGAQIYQLPTNDIMKYSLLNWAASYAYVDIVKLLLDHGANPNMVGKNCSVLQDLMSSFLLQPEHIQVAKFLLAKGADTRTALEHVKVVNELRLKFPNELRRDNTTEFVRQEIIKLLENAPQTINKN